MRVAQVYIKASTKSLLWAISGARKQTEPDMTPDQVADELLTEIIHDKYPFIRILTAQIDDLEKQIVAEIKNKNEAFSP
jgi:Mg2+ and Co2+ transporter CorA